jgi:hypothetical protein
LFFLKLATGVHKMAKSSAAGLMIGRFRRGFSVKETALPDSLVLSFVLSFLII